MYEVQKENIARFTTAYLVTSRLVSVTVAVMDQQMCASCYRWYQLFLCIHIENCSYMCMFLQCRFTGHLTVLYKQDRTLYFI